MTRVARLDDIAAFFGELPDWLTVYPFLAVCDDELTGIGIMTFEPEPRLYLEVDVPDQSAGTKLLTGARKLLTIASGLGHRSVSSWVALGDDRGERVNRLLGFYPTDDIRAVEGTYYRMHQWHHQ